MVAVARQRDGVGEVDTYLLPNVSILHSRKIDWVRYCPLGKYIYIYYIYIIYIHLRENEKNLALKIT